MSSTTGSVDEVIGHRLPKLKIRDIRHERNSSVSAYKVVLCYNGLNLNCKGLYGKTMDLFSMVEIKRMHIDCGNGN